MEILQDNQRGQDEILVIHDVVQLGRIEILVIHEILVILRTLVKLGWKLAKWNLKSSARKVDMLYSPYRPTSIPGLVRIPRPAHA